MRGEKLFGQTLLQQMYDQVPESNRMIIMERKKHSLSPNGKDIRIQCYIPKEMYVCLVFYGALTKSESSYFQERVVEDLTVRGLRAGAILHELREQKKNKREG